MKPCRRKFPERHKIMEGKRQYLLDGLRGLTLISMILYHGMFDLLEIYGVHVSWFWRLPGIIWQQSICWIFMPEERITFGILTFLGSAMLLLVLLKPLLEHIPSVLGFLGNAVLFFLARDVNAGYWGTEAFRLGEVPKSWYQGWISTFLGFPPEDFFSGDYFSLVPWLFLYLSGYFLYDIVIEKKSFQKLMEVRIKPLEWIGRRSLLIYLLHQPAVLLGLEAFWCVKDMLFKGYGI